MTSINPINVNAQGIAGGYAFGSKPKAEKEEVKDSAESKTLDKKPQVAADDVLNYLANSAPVAAPKTIDPTKYVDETSAKRIAGFMADFEDIVASNLAAITAEFPEISGSAAMTLALAQVKE